MTQNFRGLVSVTVYAERVDILMTLNGHIFLDILRNSNDETLINATLTVVGNIISSSEGIYFKKHTVCN